VGISSEDDADGEYDEDEDDEVDVRELDDVSKLRSYSQQIVCTLLNTAETA
jgi:hypothetical protein